MKTYTLNVAGLTRELQLFEVNEHLDIAGFIMLSDVEMTVRCAEELIKKIGVENFDCIMTAETKGIPLAYEMSRQSGKKYFVARKSQKVYMRNVHVVNVKSITTLKEQKLYITQEDWEQLSGKRVVIVDDVISTGGSLAALEDLVNEAGAKIAAKAAVLAEGDAAGREDIVFLEALPVFPK